MRARRRVHRRRHRGGARRRGRRRCGRRAAPSRSSTRCSAARRPRRQRACARPGHHAEPDARDGLLLLRQRGGGRAARASPPTALERVLILDWDVHHGNGTNAIFHADPDVLFVSIHEWPLYPGTGPASRPRHRATAQGFTVNLPVPGGLGRRGLPLAGRARRLRADRARWEPQLVLDLGGLRRPPRRPARDLPRHRGGLRGDDGVAAAGRATRWARRSASCSRAATPSARWRARWRR